MVGDEGPGRRLVKQLTAALALPTDAPPAFPNHSQSLIWLSDGRPGSQSRPDKTLSLAQKSGATLASPQDER